MACNCHGKAGKAEKLVHPEDQCTTCAYKHIRLAAETWGEFTYQLDNREFAATQLRLAIEHLKLDHTPTALKCRDLAVMIEEVRDSDTRAVAAALRDLTKEARMLYLADHPDIPERLERLTASLPISDVTVCTAAAPPPETFYTIIRGGG